MKRMVKNGDLIDVEPDGTITAGGKTINGVEANPTGEATQTLEKIKIGDVAYKVGGGGGTSGSVVITNPATNRTITLSVGRDAQDYVCDTLNIIGKDGNKLGFNLYANSTTLITKIRFDGISNNKYLVIKGDNITEGYAYISASRASIPDVPKSNGTYMLKATVSNDSLTYSWELQQ